MGSSVNVTQRFTLPAQNATKFILAGDGAVSNVARPPAPDGSHG
jgi:hypothetical protein